jgi:hypothetical protein
MERHMTHPSLIVAAVLTLAVGVAHSWLGERVLFRPLLAAPASEGPLARGFLRGIVRHAWHITSLAWAGMGLVLAGFAFAPLDRQGRWAVAVIGAVFLAHGLYVLAISRGRHLAWIAFLAIGALAIGAAWAAGA